jgi:hypothetical protein
MQKPYFDQSSWYSKSSLRLLIVGESHYHDCDGKGGACEWCSAAAKKDLTRHTVMRLALEKENRFFGKVRKLIAGKNADPVKFWQSVAYCNALSFIFQKPGEPVPEQVRLNAKTHRAIANLLEELAPKRLLILGKSNWKYFPSETSPGLQAVIETRPVESFRLSLAGVSEVDNKAYWYRVRGRDWVLAAGIYHPRYISGFNSPTTRKVVKRLMSDEFKAPN